METTRDRAASALIALATALVDVALALPLFLNPVWVAFEQRRSQAALVLAAAAAIVAARRRGADRARTWRAVRGGGLALIATLAVGGVVSVLAFDTVFEAFDQIFFAGGSYTFDPATERLVQIFPFEFWQETAIVVGAVCVVLAAVVALIAHDRAASVVTAARTTEDRDGAMSDGTSPSMAAAGSSR